MELEPHLLRDLCPLIGKRKLRHPCAIIEEDDEGLSFQPLRRSPGHKTGVRDKRPSQWSLNRRSLCKLKEAEGVILDSDDRCQ